MHVKSMCRGLLCGVSFGKKFVAKSEGVRCNTITILDRTKNYVLNLNRGAVAASCEHIDVCDLKIPRVPAPAKINDNNR